MKVLLFIFAMAVASVCGKVVPDDFPKCKKSDPEIVKCIKEAVEIMKPRLKAGIPELNIPSLDPFTVPTLRLDKSVSNLRLKAVLKNTVAYGGSNFKIEKLKLNLNNKYLAELKLTIPKLIVSAEYDIQGSRILNLDISGNAKGKMKGNFTGITVVVKGIAKPIEKDAVEYLQADKIVAKLKINNGRITLDDSERPAEATSAAAFFNATPRVILDVLNPLIEETIAAVLKAFLNKVLGAIPLKELLVDE